MYRPGVITQNRRGETMSFSSTQWVFDPSVRADPIHPIVIDTCRQRDGTILYAIRQTGAVFTAAGEWEYEPIPSSRDDAFIARARYDTWEAAAKMIIKHFTRCPTGRIPVRQCQRSNQ